jgi:hypothetical protein
MRQFRYLFLLALGLFSNASESALLNDFSTLRWENRLIIVNQPTDPDYVLSLMKNHSEGIVDRHIVWFILKDSEALTNYSGQLSESFMSNIKQQYRFKKNTVTLIGKDGGIKSQGSTVDVKALFLTIDAMYMRQREIQQKS